MKTYKPYLCPAEDSSGHGNSPRVPSSRLQPRTPVHKCGRICPGALLREDQSYSELIKCEETQPDV